MIKQNDTEHPYEPMRGPGWTIKFKIPEQVEKEYVKVIKDKIKEKDGSHRD